MTVPQYPLVYYPYRGIAALWWCASAYLLLKFALLGGWYDGIALLLTLQEGLTAWFMEEGDNVPL